ncbi:MAG TPA: hypothetical protein DEH11_22605 [Actinobacteria bacterium]|nr:hypothetical protein [Actinomycetota bacterium]
MIPARAAARGVRSGLPARSGEGIIGSSVIGSPSARLRRLSPNRRAATEVRNHPGRVRTAMPYTPTIPVRAIIRDLVATRPALRARLSRTGQALKETRRGAPMASGDYGEQPSSPMVVARGWQATLTLGVLTLILGIVVSFHPTGSLNVVAVLFGILMILSGIFHLIRVLDSREAHRVWLGIAGLMFIVVGVLLIRHLHLTRAVIGLIIGITWIVQGLAALMTGIAGDVREGRGWWIAFGGVSLIAGIVVASTPASSLSVLAVLLGIWFIIMGIFEIVAGLMLRRAIRDTAATLATPLAHP